MGESGERGVIYQITDIEWIGIRWIWLVCV